MALTYFATDRIQGTNAERIAMTIENRTQDYASLLSTYSPDFALLFDEGTGTPVNEGTNKNVTMAVSNSNPAWTANSGGFLGTSGSYGMKFDQDLSTGAWNENAPCIHWDDLQGGTTQNWTVMMLIKFLDHVPDNNMIGYRGDPYNNAMNVGCSLNHGDTPCGNKRFGQRAHYNSRWNGTNSSTDLVADVWQTLCISNTTSNTHKMYVNGVQDGSGSFSGGGNNPISGLAVMNDVGGQGDAWIIDSIVYANSTQSDSNILGWDSKLRGVTYTYPNMPKGTIFEASDTGKHWMWDGTSAWEEIS